MPKKARPKKKVRQAIPDARTVVETVLAATNRDVAAAAAEAAAKKKAFKRDLNFAIAFAKYMGEQVAAAFQDDFPGIVSGEKVSQAVRGLKRVDVKYATREAGLGLALSFKSVHRGEDGDDAGFIHNMKRNDEELRVEATGHHLRQPYAVMVAVVFLPFESCQDGDEQSSFASWVEYLWPLKGREEPEDAPDRYELVFMALYARDGSRLAFYEVGGKVACPRTGEPKALLSFSDFLERMRKVYDARNGRDFFFEGEAPEE